MELYSFAREDRKCRPGQGRHSSSLHTTAKADCPGVCPLVRWWPAGNRRHHAALNGLLQTCDRGVHPSWQGGQGNDT